MTGLARHLDRQRAAFSSLARQGVYWSGQAPPAAIKPFFQEILSVVLDRAPLRPNVLDCGCGAGSWLALLRGIHRDRVNLYGFDLTPAMVALAARTLGGAALVQEGNVLDNGAYRFRDGRHIFDAIYAYDLVQQLPRNRQLAAMEKMLEHVVPGGTLIVFDCDRNSDYGRKMALQKWLTLYTFLPLVPRHYCNATYPPLSQFFDQFTERGCKAEIRMETSGKKRALIVQTPQ